MLDHETQLHKAASYLAYAREALEIGRTDLVRLNLERAAGFIDQAHADLERAEIMADLEAARGEVREQTQRIVQPDEPPENP